MKPRNLFLFAYYSFVLCSIQVSKTDLCNACTQFKSLSDCNKYGCTWTAGTLNEEGSCAENILQKTSASAYCSGATECAKTLGCAYLDNTCTNFAGCSAYTKQSFNDCQTISSKCVWEGAYCIDARPCNQYTQQFCSSTVDLNGRKCTWDLTYDTCRNFDCYEADATYKTDEACKAFSQDCMTNGSGCVMSFHCDDCFISQPSKKCSDQQNCVKDSNGNPCLKVNGICYDYISCKSVTTANSLAECQAFNSLCVLSYSTCIAQKSCENYISERECQIGINNTKCIWLPNSYKCQVFEKCSDVEGTTLTYCYNINKQCVSDGEKCVNKDVCSSYRTQTACSNEGTDGKCKWEETSSTCRSAVCSDFTFTKPSECAQLILAKGACTSDGVTCVERTQCVKYKTEQECTIDSEGKQCIFIQSCRNKICEDEVKTTNEQCQDVVVGRVCISNGRNCVEKQACSNYLNQISCNAGGSDGICAFTNTGTCQLFTSCEIANNDQVACNKKPACQWQSDASNQTFCKTKTCLQAASGTTSNNILSFDETKFTICALVMGVCTESDPSVLNGDTCYQGSAYTYTWNESTKKCVQCVISNDLNNGTNSTVINSNTTVNQILIRISFTLIVMFAF